MDRTTLSPSFRRGFAPRIAPTGDEPMTTKSEKEIHRRDLDNSANFRSGEINVPYTIASTSVSFMSGRDNKHNQTQVTSRQVELEKKNEAQRNRKPLLYCRFVVNYPKLSFALTLGCHLLIILVTGVLFASGYDIFPLGFDKLPVYLQDETSYLRQMAWNLRNHKDNKIISRLQLTNNIIPERRTVAQVLEIYFELKDGNVFTKDVLKTIQSVEEELLGTKDYREKFCHLDTNSNCTKSTSILRYFDGTYAQIDPLMSDINFDNIPGALGTALSNNITKHGIKYHLGINYTVDETTGLLKSSITRTRILLAYPLSGYNGTDDRKDEQLEKIKLFVNTTMYAKLEDLQSEDRNGIDFFYFNGDLLTLSLTSTAMDDLILVACGLGFIFIFVWIETQSLWITGFSVLSIFTGFLWANLIYRVAFDIKFFGLFNVLALFIILGIGADDVFIFVDTFKSTGHHDYLSLEHRLSDCYRKASGAMLFSSLSTAIAFFVSAASRIVAVSTFGLFAGLLVVVNYLTVITYLPPVVVIWHNKWESWNWCSRCKMRSNVRKVEDFDKYADEEEDIHHRKNPVVKFFRGPYFKVISHKIARWIIIIIFLGLATTVIYFATQLKPNEDEIEILKPETNFGKSLDRIINGFAPIEDSTGVEEALQGLSGTPTASSEKEGTNVEIIIAWGLKNQDFSICHKTNFTCFGNTVWDDQFDLNSAEAQRGLSEFCSYMKNLSPEEENDLNVQRNALTNEFEVGCFIHDLDAFMKTEGNALAINNTRKYPSNASFTTPLLKENVETLMASNPTLYNLSTLPSGFKRYFETGLSYWLYDGFKPNSKLGAFQQYSRMLGEQVEDDQSHPYKVADFTYGNRLRYAAIIVNTTIHRRSLGYPKGIPFRDRWEEFVSKKMAELPMALQGGIQLTTAVWHYMDVQKNLADSALLGVLIGVSVALPILIMATDNIVTGLLAGCVLAIITASVVGFIVMNGWTLGVLESLNMVLVVGLSLDYIVHLAGGYSRSPHDSRLERTRDMLEEVGISVLSGAVTTSGATFLMMGAQVLFFSKFGLIMFSTIFFSIVYSLVLFPTVLALLGPQGDIGCISSLFKKCCPRLCKT